MMFPQVSSLLTSFRALPWAAKVVVAFALAAGINRLVAGPKKRKSLNDRLVVITGAGSGIGKIMAFMCAERGAQVALWDINFEAVSAVAAEMKARFPARSGFVHPVFCDVSSEASVKVAHRETLLLFSGVPLTNRTLASDGDLSAVLESLPQPDPSFKVDVMICNAGVVHGRPLVTASRSQIERTFSVNALGPVWCTRAVLPAMMTPPKGASARGGHIVYVSSASALVAPAGLGDYAASKAAVSALGESVRMETQAKNRAAPGWNGVHTSIIMPIYINTGMFEGAKMRSRAMAMLDQDWTAAQIIKSIEEEREVVPLPRSIWMVSVVRALFPTRVFDWVAFFSGSNNSMDNFSSTRALSSSSPDL
ncbi:hypothetical protein H696_00339 [Fonticula alba]|uniref:Uncharacterized protein n=1 Tax=Fonticula alba TaxID=691883 RepID=A0A058ZFN1_FONAL|nr:hypothetical protein H696_00339 [Fonticula alba]KCV72761.1 hypothetical protein H696_00339 [Fonticula alba]|eukprot:XP_009492462.1 hypothetical protein H696_00339 [Fonticula alba]